ncbi:MAG: flagellar basal-body rod protein FlgF [Bdellovibrionales bacterium]|nr:flagellar basal-body rod protein FlgF [Bdellovibrionales bacterium]
MSSKGIYTALSGAMAQSQRLDTIANNIANTNTASFKKDKQTFYEYLTAAEKNPDSIQTTKVPASIESFYELNGADRGFVDSSGTYTDFTQGQLKPTGNKLDVALQGKGFFEILTPNGPRLTRNGQFQVDANGRLVTRQGYPVLSEGTGDPQQRTIQLNSNNVTVSYSGEIYEGNDLAAKFALLNVVNPESLKKSGQSFYDYKENMNPILQAADEVQTKQGFVEASNVNIVTEMTDMINATRTFESTQKAIKAFDQINQKLAIDVPKTSY